MKNLYLKLASTNIKSSKQFYMPYLLTGILTVAMFYAMIYLCTNEGLKTIPGSDSLSMILVMGSVVIAIFSAVFMFYTNSFIIKRRKKEIGIYNILGMEKRHISKVIAIETAVVAFIAIAGGIITGVVFSKLLTMLLYKMMRVSQNIVFSVSLSGIKMSIILFLSVYAVILIYNLMQIKMANPIELVRGNNVGEREPKTKLFMAIEGVVFIGIGYYMAITTRNPLEAINLFFIAVVCVIAGTYCLFMSGSILLLKLLRKNKSFYYKRGNFTAVSGMIYRMKQNAVGLSNICILSTMVLVMLSTTISMFLGTEEELNNRYMNEISIDAYFTAPDSAYSVMGKVEEVVSECGRNMTNVSSYGSVTLFTTQENENFIIDANSAGANQIEKMCLMNVITLEEYNKMIKGSDLARDAFVDDIPKGSVAIVGYPEYTYDTMFLLGDRYNVIYNHKYISDSDEVYMNMVGGYYYVVVDNVETQKELMEKRRAIVGEDASQYLYSIGFDIDGTVEEKLECISAIRNAGLESYIDSEYFDRIYIETRQENADDFYTIYGGLFFIGVFLGIMFLMVTVLIIFYKQISEGYEDKERFKIMEKVGMSSDEVKKSIRTQVRIVFFLPIATAAIHLAAAFPMITRLLYIFNLSNTTLFMTTMVGTTLVFAVIYYVIFKITSRSYYKIVGNQV